MGILQQFNGISKYIKKGSSNEFENMFSRSHTSKIIIMGTRMHMVPFIYHVYKDGYTKDEDFKEIFQ